MVRVRADQVGLQIIIGRWQKVKVPRQQHVCAFCGCGDVEDVEHLLVICPALWAA